MTDRSASIPIYSDCRGISLVEIMIGLAILATVAAIAIPNYVESVHTAKVVQAMGDIKDLQIAIDLQLLGGGRYPNSLAEAGIANKNDPWGNPYEYLRIAGGVSAGQCRKDKFLVPLNDDYDLYSKGRDGESTSPLTADISRDDVVRAANGGFIGPAENY
jgi:general secretion pathway protein G